MATFPLSDYPGAIDSDIPVAVDGEVIPATYGNGLRNAVLATQTELGANPSGASADVAARFTAVEGAATTLAGRVTTAEADIAALGGGGVTTVGDQGQRLASALDQRETPATLFILGDSTGLGTGTNGKWVDYLAERIGVEWPHRKVTLRSYVSGSSTYGSPATVANASETAVLDVYNGSVGSTLADYPTTRIPAMIPVEPDLVIISYGHNHNADLPADLIADLDAMVTAIRAEWPDAPVAISSQNPQFTPATYRTQHNAREVTKREYADANGFAYVAGYESIMAQVSPSAWVYTDGIHPLMSGATDGSSAWADAALRTLLAVSEKPPTALTVQDENANVATGVTRVDFQGAGVTTTAGTGEVVVTIPGGSGYVYRDRLVATAGQDTLTLGASPVASSPLVWVNGTIKWPTTDYGIVGSVITFGSALSASDVVAVQYHSAAASASASALSTVGGSILDNFDRANSTTDLGVTSSGAKTWTQHAGTWGISSNKAYVSAGHAGNLCLASFDAGAGGNNGTVSTVITGSSLCGLIVRADGSGNHYLIEVQPGGAAAPKIYKTTGGTNSVIATGATTTVAAGSVISVVLTAGSIVVKDDGVTIVSASDATWNANTRHGMYIVAGAGVSPTARHDDFSFTV